MRAAALACVVLLATAGKAAPPKICIAVVEEGAGRLSLLTDTGTPMFRLPLGLRPHEIAIARNGRTAFIPMFGVADYNNREGVPGKTIAVVDLAKGTLTRAIALPPDVTAPHGVQLRGPRERELFVNTEVGGDHMLVFDPATGRLLRRFLLPPLTHNFIFNRSGRALYSFAGKGGVSRLDPVTGAIMAHADISSPARGLRMTADGALAVAGKGEVVVLDAKSLAVVRRLSAPTDAQLAYLETLPDGTIVAPALFANGVAIFPPNGAASFVATGKVALVARRGANGATYVSNVMDNHLSVVSATSGVTRAIGALDGPNAIAPLRCPKSPVR